MKPAIVTTSARRPNRILILLAAAWMIVSLTIGGQITGTAPTDTSASTSIATTTTASRP